jgi:hypothetical protein
VEESGDRRGPGQHSSFKDTLPVTYFSQPGPTFHNSTSYQSSVKILNPSMD